jgi:hypothetical protein
MQEKLRMQKSIVLDDSKEQNEIMLDKKEEMAFVESLVGSQTLNLWALLMPAVYQLVPGAMVARLWFNSLFPPQVTEEITDITAMVNNTITATNITTQTMDANANNVFSNLMVISTSLAVGLILGFSLLHLIVTTFALIRKLCGCEKKNLTEEEKEKEAHRERAWDRLVGMFTSQSDDPKDRTADEPADAINTNDGPSTLGGQFSVHQPSAEVRGVRSDSTASGKSVTFAAGPTTHFSVV